MKMKKVCDFDFIATINLRIYKGFDRQNRSGDLT